MFTALVATPAVIALVATQVGAASALLCNICPAVPTAVPVAPKLVFFFFDYRLK